MKTKQLLTVLLLFISFASASQKRYGMYTNDVFKVTVIEPGLSYEFGLGKNTTLFLRGGMTATLATDYNDNITGVLFRPFLPASHRTYYNFRKRELIEKNISNNTGNYFAFLLMAATKPINEGKDYHRSQNNNIINAGFVWGMQRNYASRFSLNLNIGLGYRKMGYEEGIMPIGELNIGFWLNRR